jgi:predicted permease
MSTLLQDLHHALRKLSKAPGFTLTALLTLAVGIGAVTAVFSVVNGVLLRPYAFPEPGRLVVWRETIQEMSSVAPLLPDSYKHYLELKQRANTITDAAILQNKTYSIAQGEDHPQIVHGLVISPNFFSVLGTRPALGRAFLPEEAQRGRDDEVILTWSAWQRFLHGDPAAVGKKTLRIGGELETVVGVLPEGFRFPAVSEMAGTAASGAESGSTERYQIFKPVVASESERTSDEGDFNFLVIARLKPGVSIAQAQSELDGLEKANAAANHVSSHLGVVVEPLTQETMGNASKALWLLLAAVLGVLLIGCVNLANLQLARAVARDREIAIRTALGAGRRRLMQAALAESLVLAVGGGIAGILLALGGVRLFLLIAPANLPRLNEISGSGVHVSGAMLLVALGLSVVTTFVFGLLPALHSSRVPPQQALQSNAARLSSTRQATRTRRVLVAVEVGASVVLLVVTGLIARSFSKVLTQNREFNAAQVTLAEADLFAPRYSDGGALPDDWGSDHGSFARDAFLEQALDRLRRLPGVEAAAITSVVPLTGDISVDALARPDHPLRNPPPVNRRIISPGYFAAMGIPLLAGREFDARERENLRSAIISEKTAKAVWPGENALGHTFVHWGRTYTVVGIAADARINSLKQDVAVFYLPYWDYPPFHPVFLVRSTQPAETLAPALRRELWRVDPAVAIPEILSLDAQVGTSVAAERFQTIVLASFGAAALLLALLGIYGVLAYSVSLRTQEFGIRLALGAGRARLVRLVLTEASYPVGAGVLAGVFGALLATRLVRSLLYETNTLDPLVLSAGIGLLLATALLAALLPARRAMQVDPMRVLREE